MPVAETDPAKPTDAYGRSKLAAEEALAEIGLAGNGLDWATLRPVLVYGDGVKGNMASLLHLARSSYPLPLGSLGGRRSLVSLESLAAAVVTVLDAPGPIARPLVVAEPDALTLPEMIAAMRAGFGRGPGLVPVPPVLLRWGCRVAGRDEAYARLSTSLVARSDGLTALGWQPAQTSRDGLMALARGLTRDG